MRKIKNTIKINGRTYDAITGDLLHAGKSPAHNTPVPSTPIKTSSNPNPAKSQPSHHITSKKLTSRHAAKPANRKPEQSKTLMRHSVSKPSHAANSHDKTHIKATSSVAKRSSVISVKKSVRKIDERRLHQAKGIAKSQKIAKFSKHPIKTQPVTPQPHKESQAHSIQHHVTTTHKRRPAHRTKNSADLLQEALHHANSHTQPAHKHHRRLSRTQQAAGLSVLVVATGLLLGAVVFSSAPAIKMRVAAAKAGFSASLPGYNPAGFRMDDLSYGAGTVAMNYKSNSDEDRKFSITQKSSSWDSTTLRDTFVAGNDKDFRVAEDGGLTVYLYGQNNATWVNQGVWYQVQGNGSLSDRQLVEIAKSL